MAGQVFNGFQNIDYERKRTRMLLRGPHPDPIAKTVGTNEYSASVDLYLAEWNYFQQNVLIPLANAKGFSITSSGYGDVMFTIYVTYTALGMDPVQDILVGCTIDTTSSKNKIGPDGLVRGIELSPLKIYYGDEDDAMVLLQPPPGM